MYILYIKIYAFFRSLFFLLVHFFFFWEWENFALIYKKDHRFSQIKFLKTGQKVFHTPKPNQNKTFTPNSKNSANSIKLEETIFTSHSVVLFPFSFWILFCCHNVLSFIWNGLQILKFSEDGILKITYPWQRDRMERLFIVVLIGSEAVLMLLYVSVFLCYWLVQHIFLYRYDRDVMHLLWPTSVANP